MKKNVLVTGGSGFIGSHVVDTLVKSKYKVTILDINRPKRKDVKFVKRGTNMHIELSYLQNLSKAGEKPMDFTSNRFRAADAAMKTGEFGPLQNLLQQYVQEWLI